MPIKVLLDANFLLASPQFGLDIFGELERVLAARVEPVLLRQVKEELERIARSPTSKLGRQGRLALEQSRRCSILDPPVSGGVEVDELLIKTAKVLGCSVATNDGVLRRKLVKVGVPVIYMREMSHLVVEGFVP